MNVAILISLLITSARGSGLCLPGSLELTQAPAQNTRAIEALALDLQRAINQRLLRGLELVIRLEALDPRVNAELSRQD